MANYSIPQLLRSALAAGDMIYRSATGWARLAIGTSANQILQVRVDAVNYPQWNDIREVLRDASSLNSVRGDLMRHGATTLEKFSAKTANQVVAGDGTDVVSATLTSVIDGALGSTRGSILYRGASGWTILAPSSAGYVLEDGGSGADPSWAAPSAGSGPTFIGKSVNEDCDNIGGGSGNHTSSGSTMTADYELFASLDSGKTYLFFLVVVGLADDSADVAFDMNYTSTSSGYEQIASEIVDAATIDVNRTATIGTDGTIIVSSDKPFCLFISGTIATTGAGTLEFRWAQSNPGASVSTIYAGSFMFVLEVA